jgi:hypothetical protein
MKMETAKKVHRALGEKQKRHRGNAGKTCRKRRIQRWMMRIIRHFQIVILLEDDNKYKEGLFQDGEVLGETGEWLDLGAINLDLPN